MCGLGSVANTRRSGAGVPWSRRTLTRPGLGLGSLCLDEALPGVCEDGFDLPAGHAGEPLEEIVDGAPVFEVLEEGSDGHARSLKTQAPLTLPAPRSTAQQSLHSSMAEV